MVTTGSRVSQLLLLRKDLVLSPKEIANFSVSTYGPSHHSRGDNAWHGENMSYTNFSNHLPTKNFTGLSQ